MKRYINILSVPSRQQVICIEHDGNRYRLHIPHATLGELSRAPVNRMQTAHIHDDLFHMVLYIKGANRVQMPGGTVQVQTGTLLLTAPGDSHSFAAIDKGEVVYHEITFRFITDEGAALKLNFPRLLETLSAAGPLAIPASSNLNDLDTEELKARMAAVLNNLSTPSPLADCQVAANLAGLLAALMRLAVSRGVRTIPNQGRGIDAVLAFMASNFAVAASNENLAAKAGMSRASFMRKFKLATGTSPKVHFTGLRVAAARNLLRSTNLTLDDIACRLGFCDAYHFGRVFKQHTGITPGLFRRTG